ncbi:MAG: hypothetical protein OWQ54_07480 [Sulfolobaceae archaeon]|nr:hypothetical protein [Sulfolobaceae archaeon]
MSDDAGIKKAASLLKQGAVMLDISCPICHMPLFKLKSGEIVCPNHGKVYVVKNEEEEAKVKREVSLQGVEETLLDGLFAVAKKIKEDPSDEESLKQVIYYLDALDRVEKLIKELKGQQSQ